MSALPSGSGDRKRLVGFGLLFCASGALLAFQVAYFATGRGDYVDAMGGWIAPTLLVVGVGYTSWWAVDRDLDGAAVLRIGLWFLLGTLVLGGAALATFAYQNAQGGRMVNPVYTVGNWVTGGGLIGLVVGVYDARRYLAIEQTADARRETERLNHRLEVLHRVLRHNIRNDMNVILGYADLVESEASSIEERVEVIKRTASELYRLSEKARLFTETDDDDTRTVDLAEHLRTHVERIERDYPEVDVRTDVPDSAPVSAHRLLDIALENLLENAVEHNPEPDPWIEVAVSTVEIEGTDYATVRIEDNGPGIPELEREVLETGEETPLRHSQGMGLLLSRWIVTESGGSLAVEETGPTGSVVSLRLPRPPDGSDDPDADAPAPVPIGRSDR